MKLLKRFICFVFGHSEVDRQPPMLWHSTRWIDRETLLYEYKCLDCDQWVEPESQR